MDGPRAVVRVERAQHQVPRERGLHGDLRRRHVADFADHDDVRVLPQNRTQRRAERQLPRLVDLHLVHQLDLVLDRVLDRHDVAVHALDQLERRIERRRLAAARRAR